MVTAAASPPNLRLVETPLRFGAANHDAIMAQDPEVLVVGPAGTGKTFAICVKIHMLALQYPGVRFLMTRKTLESLKSGALATFTKHIQPHMGVCVETFGGNKFFPAEFRYSNSSVILVTGMDKADKILSSEFDLIFPNEATELAESDWEILTSRLRNGVMPFQQIIADCNPSGPRHWLNQRCNAGTTRRIQTTHRDNPAYWDASMGDWTPMGRQYVETTLAGLTGVQRKRLYEGVWAAAEGIVYPEFVPEMIRTEDTHGWTTYLAVDVGSKNPTVVLTCHVAGDGRVHVSRELYRRNMSSTDIVAAIETEADRSTPDGIYIDPSAKGYITDLQRGGYPAVPADNDVLEGIQRVKGVLTGGFSIDPDCIETIDEFGLYAYPDNPKIETDKPVKEHDHGMDCLRYLANGITEPTVNLADYYGGMIT